MADSLKIDVAPVRCNCQLPLAKYASSTPASATIYAVLFGFTLAMLVALVGVCFSLVVMVDRVEKSATALGTTWATTLSATFDSAAEMWRSSISEGLSRGDSKTRLEILSALEQGLTGPPQDLDPSVPHFLLPLLEECRYDCDPAVSQLAEKLLRTLALPESDAALPKPRNKKAATR